MSTNFPRYAPRKGPGLSKVPESLKGENHHAAKMRQADVDELRADRAGGMTLEQCFLKWHARRGISYVNVCKILAHHSWK